jgi:hypothetical protein
MNDRVYRLVVVIGLIFTIIAGLARFRIFAVSDILENLMFGGMFVAWIAMFAMERLSRR